MKERIIVAAVQMTSVEDWQVNLRKAEDLVKEAAARGAQIVALPENFAYLRGEGEQIPCVQSIEGEFIQRMKALTAEHRIYLLCGTIPEKTEGAQIYNTSVLLDPAGRAIAVYRKIHLFDVNLPGRAVFQESKLVKAGRDLVTAQTEFGTVGLTVCYDLRFPELFRRLTLSGAHMIFVPSAFTEYTGKDHWEVLLRARAIENQVYIIAPAQFGQHSPKRRSYGKALIVDPWGTVLAKAADQEGVILADVDFRFQDKIRRELPCLEHIRMMD